MSLSLSLFIIEISFQSSYNTGLFKDQAIQGEGNTCTYTVYPLLYHRSEDNFVEFCRDYNGYVQDQYFTQSGESIYICGGSTTETYIVPTSARWPAILEKLSGSEVTNDSSSGRTFSECINRFESYLEKFTKPNLVLFVNNVNTLGKFAIDQSTPFELTLYQNFRVKIRNFYYSVFPGIATARNSGFFQRTVTNAPSTLVKKNVIKKGKIFEVDSSYPSALDDGCCHFATGPNSTYYDGFFDWMDDRNIMKYQRFYQGELKKLQRILNKFNLRNNQVIFGFETYSYNLGKSKYGDPRRLQLLSEKPGVKLGPSESYFAVNRFDAAIKSLLSNQKWDYFDSQIFLNSPEFFYDVVHLTHIGSEAMGRGVFDFINSRKT